VSTFDLVIRNGTVVDGSGFGSYRADVGVKDGIIVEIGRIHERGEQEVDAEGHVVTPGFIDGHTHMDAQVFWDADGANSCWHGVTTVVMGNCGFTLAPVRQDSHALVVRNLERAEDIDPTALANGINWGWESFTGYMDAVDRTEKAINYAANVGHSALRTWAMGERAFEQEASDEDLELMTGHLAEAIRAGAIGFSTSRSEHHETSDNRPVASRLASWDEVRALVGVMGRLGTGIFEGGAEGSNSPDPEVRARASTLMTDLAVETGVTLTSGIIATNPGGYETLEMIDAVAAAGGRMIGQSHCRGISVLLGFKTRLPFDVLPEWEPVRALPLSEQRRALEDPEMRQRLVDSAMAGDYGRWRGIGAMPRKPDFDGIRVYDRGLPPHRNLNQIARSEGVTPVDVLIDLSLATDFDQLFIQPSMFPQDDEVLRKVLRHPRTVMTFSDSGAHLGQICDASIHTYLLGHWVRNMGEFTLEEAVRMITLAPAMAWGFSDRGLLREGAAADINVFDPVQVGPAVPRVVNDLPGGGKRLEQRANGFKATAVNGQLTIVDGQHTGVRPGSLLRNSLARRSYAST
jgi:N-acyl-D-aspartate/D-glutamate deacylase